MSRSTKLSLTEEGKQTHGSNSSPTAGIICEYATQVITTLIAWSIVCPESVDTYRDFPSNTKKYRKGCSPWLYRLPDRPQGHVLYPKKSLHVRMSNIRYSVEGGIAFRLSENYSYAYVFIRIRAHVLIIWCFPEPQKNFRKKIIGHFRRTISWVG